MAAPCCPPGSHGPAPPATAALRGSMVRMGALSAYVVNAESATTRAVVCGPDIFGLDSGSSKAICDRVARDTGHVVVMPDLYEGEPWPEAWGMPTARLNLLWFVPWLRRHNNDAARRRLYDSVVPYLESRGVESWAWYGFCVGATMCAPLSADARCKGGVGCHPSFNALTYAGGPSFERTFGAFKSPLLVIASANESKDARVTAPALVRAAGQSCVVSEYNENKHGFVNRGDPNDPAVGPERERAIQEMVAFLSRVLS